MRKIVSLSLILGMSLLSACTHEVDLSYSCVPSGANIYEEGVGDLGPCPVTLKYNSYDVAIQGDKLYTRKIRVSWKSGASLLVPPTEVQIIGDRSASMTFVRPQDLPGYQIDQTYSAAFEKRAVTPEDRYFVSPDQDRNAFDTLDKSISCSLSTLTRDVEAVCGE